MRLIDGNTLKAEFTGNFNGGYYTVAEIKAYIDTAPTVDAVPVVHGKWVKESDYWEDDTWVCSNCQCKWFLEASTPKENEMYYCPTCGAKMIGDDE